MDYRKYHFTKVELMRYLGFYALLDGAVSLLFYRSWIAIFVLFPGIWFYLKDRRQVRQKKRRQELERQFLMGMQAVSNALAAGYSVENAFAEAQKEMERVYGREEMIVKEFRTITAGLAMNRTLEALVLDLANRSGVEDIQSFGEVFAAAKRSGGDLIAIIRNTVSTIRQKEETRQEIRVCIASKQMEQNVMSCVPLFILAYVGIASPGFLDSMYGNVSGIMIMSVCLVVYFASWLLGKHIVGIEV